jgi:hypothetical protein
MNARSVAASSHLIPSPHETATTPAVELLHRVMSSASGLENGSSGTLPLLRLVEELQECRVAITEEHRALEADSRDGLTPVGPGVRLETRGNGTRYQLNTHGPSRGIRSGEAVGYEIGDVRVPAEVYAVHGCTVTLAVGEDLGACTAEGVLLRDTRWLVRSLESRVTAIRTQAQQGRGLDRFHLATVCAALGLTDPVVAEQEPDERVWLGDTLDLYQRGAVRNSMGSRVTRVIGPPGTGKTIVLARAVEGHVRAGRRVLLIGKSNRSVDVAFTAVYERLAHECHSRDGFLVRYGSRDAVELIAWLAEALCLTDIVHRRLAGVPPTGHQTHRQVSGLRGILADLDRRPHLDPDETLRSSARKCLDAVGRGLSRRAPLIRLLSDPERVAAATNATLRAARVVATTVAQTHLAPQLAHERWDVVVVDEASQLSAADLVAVASLAPQLTLVGDYRQTAPIARAPATRLSERWLRTEPFTLVGVPDDLERRDPPAHLSVLRVQHRCDPAIRRTYGDAYGDLLIDHDSVTSRDPARYVLGRDRAEPETHTDIPRRGTCPLLYIDTHQMQPIVEQVGGSRRNRAHVEAVRSLIWWMHRTGRVPRDGMGEVAVLAPFRCQVAAHVAALRTLPLEHGPRVGTVHVTQGDAVDIVVLDLVDTRSSGPSRFLRLSDSYDQEGARMLTVALSRARFHIVLVGDITGIRDDRRYGRLTRQLVNTFTREGRPLSLRELAP